MCTLLEEKLWCKDDRKEVRKGISILISTTLCLSLCWPTVARNTTPTTGGREEESLRERQRSNELTFHAEGAGSGSIIYAYLPTSRSTVERSRRRGGSTGGEAGSHDAPVLALNYRLCHARASTMGWCGGPGLALSLCRAWHGHYGPRADPGMALRSTALSIHVCVCARPVLFSGV
jgi:hypothetical protein